MIVRQFKAQDTDQVVALWQECELTRPWNNPLLDIERKQQQDDSLFLVGELDNHLIASVMGGYDGHRGWMYYLAVSPKHQRCGYSRELISHLEQKLIALGCPKLNLQIRPDNIAVQEFYHEIGFTEDATVSMGKRLIPD